MVEFREPDAKLREIVGGEILNLLLDFLKVAHVPLPVEDRSCGILRRCEYAFAAPGLSLPFYTLHYEIYTLIMLGMKRAYAGLLRAYLKTFPCVALLGVRQCGDPDRGFLGILDRPVERVADVHRLVAKMPGLSQFLLVEGSESLQCGIEGQRSRHR